jgi:hypothetical protein
LPKVDAQINLICANLRRFWIEIFWGWVDPWGPFCWEEDHS